MVVSNVDETEKPFGMELILANIALLGVIAFLLHPGEEAPEFVVFFSGVLIAGVLGIRFYKERDLLKLIKKSPVTINVNGVTFHFDNPERAETVRPLLENRPLKGLPRHVFIGSFPGEAETRRGEFIGIINTDVAGGDVMMSLLELQRRPLYWLDFTSTSGLLLRILIPTVMTLARVSPPVMMAIVVIAGFIFGMIDDANLQYLPL